jgi:phosphatidylinositol-3,4,5-trisphosphate 3-phosphatase/dual-specificity protein phosphatase PTEN
MEWLNDSVKRLVSRDLNRHIEGPHNLDLTYISPRIIGMLPLSPSHSLLAMGFPASGVEGLFRNHIDECAAYLNERHPGHYKVGTFCILAIHTEVFNLSLERDYDHSVFHNSVVNMGFPDHHAPPLTKLFKIILTMDQWYFFCSFVLFLFSLFL